ncbi:hypothetical protein KAFR_0B00180 [Kazachstania africana CBS 2517]|uniref:Major facilitator superfamily (MFS) profile domain-containing protein n=1 Tax=Kazachstania africana (strain ATCC 22294 / BCRC 22015 / CBS 2517 / CECT 1963 / NBRC 1671 / NRRL Y-8276) TaxID=1071382 RepID=H2APL8_KAZAF|nr:hypothetical protein KAFR_0B00180 [Kazachstania africana CBS 2517]CCF56318.1 hypothetical protein KAFR_0B00180 [Kazachstania africana CBS 2517]
MYLEAFKNTFFVDLLEYFHLVNVHENIQNKYTERNDTSMYEDSSSADIESKAGRENPVGDSAPFLVDWNGNDDPDNPQNWSDLKKNLIVFEVILLTCTNYMGSSIYTPGQDGIQNDFHVGQVTATLNLSLYVLGCGLGQVFFSPLSEVAKIGRQQIYIVTFPIFMLIQIGCATVQNIEGLIILRLLTGILCSPPLSTGGASIADVIHPGKLTTYIALWAVGTLAAPIIGPLLGASMVVAKNWRWTFWLLLWLSIPCLICCIFFFPETSAANILSRRASRIRKQTGDNRYHTEQEMLDAGVTPKDFLINTLYRPIEIIVKEPIVLAFDVYTALCFGTLYLFFEALPIVFVENWGFTLIELGLSYFGFCVGCCVAFSVLLLFVSKIVKPRRQDGTFVPETFLILAMSVSWSLPCALFLFGWAAMTHWIVPIIAEIFFVLFAFNLFQTAFSYLALCYPNYIASVYAGNGLCRCVFGCAFPLFGRAMYNNLAIDGYPVGWGSSIIGFISLALALIPFVLYKYGEYLRSKSSFTG